MATGILQHRRGGTVARLLVTPAAGELFVDSDTWKVYIGDGSTAGGVEIGSNIATTISTLTKTSNYGILAGDNGTRFNNIGAGGTVILTLPTAAANLQFAAGVFVAQYLELLASGSDVIRYGGVNSAAGGYIRSNQSGAFIQIEAHGTGAWIISSDSGSWSVDA